MAEDKYISLSEAKSLLGVSENTLRKMFDGGYVQGFVTPGGHRRFSLKSVLSEQTRRAEPGVAGINFKNKE